MRREKRKKLRYLERILAEWYGPERAAQEILQYKSKARKVGDVVQDLVADVISEDLLLFMKIQENWERIAGNRIARFATPYQLDGNILVVEVNHPVWLRELRTSARELILKKIQDEWGQDACQDIKFVPGGRRANDKGNFR